MMTMRLVLGVVMCLMQGARAVRLTACESAIYFCCDPFSNSLLPLRCFELNRCPGLYWAGPRICSDHFIDKVTRKRLRPEKPITLDLRTTINEVQVERIKPQKKSKKKKMPTTNDINTLSSKHRSVSGPLPFNEPIRTPLSSPLVSTKAQPIKTSLASLVQSRDTRTRDPSITCSRAILRCCDAQSTRLPLRCFEQNGCPGIIWQRHFGACSPELVTKVGISFR